MIIYLALLIPVITAIVLYVFYNHQTAWWEFAIPFLASLIFIFATKFTVEKVLVSSNEYWGSLVDRVEYYEDWDEWVVETCTRSCCCDSKGQNCGTETYDCSHSVYHAPVWQIITTSGDVISISRSEYEEIKNNFSNQSFVELNRDYYTKDGNEYVSNWMKDSAKAVPVTTLHSYENRVKVADQSVFHFSKVSDKDIKKYALKDYPPLYGYRMGSVVGDTTYDAIDADKIVGYTNGLLGSKKQVRIFILVFKNQPMLAGFYQKAYWSNGNKNEFVVCVGIDKQRNVNWCNVFSWTKSELLKAEVKNYVQSQGKLNLKAIASYMKPKIESEFVRRQFKEFNYLTVEPPLGAVIFAYIFTAIINILLSFWIVRNEYN